MESDHQKNLSSELSDYLDTNDCLTDALISIYENSRWCMKFFFKSLWQILLITKEDFHYEKIHNREILSMNNSAGENHSYRKLPRHQSSRMPRNNRLPKSNSQHTRQDISSKVNLLSNQTRVTVRSISNQNLNHATSTNEKLPSNTLGSINSHIIVAPVDSSHCRNLISTNNQLSNYTDAKGIDNVNLREQLADALCRRSYEPLTFLNRGMCCGHCRPLFFPNLPFPHSTHYVFPSAPTQEKELSQKLEYSPQMLDTTETQSTQYSVSPNLQSQSIGSPVDELLSVDTTVSNHETMNEQNHSVLSFPEHDTPLSQQSEKLVDDDSQLISNAQILVDDSIQDAQEKYRKTLQISTDQGAQNKTLTIVEQVIKNKSTSSESKMDKPPTDDPLLCQELCEKLNLSDPTQITEIMRILTSNAPHVLKEPPPINTSTVNKENNTALCSQLLLHPPFKPKRLIHLCPDGSIQVLSAIDDAFNEKQMNNQTQYQLNYSNSALRPSIQHNQMSTNKSSLALIDVETNFNHMVITKSTSTEQSHSTNEILLDHLILNHNSILSLRQKQTLLKDKSPLTLPKDVLAKTNHSKAIFHDDDPIVKIDLGLHDETTEEKKEEDENSLPDIFFKRIVAPECSIPSENDGEKEVKTIRRRYHRKSQHRRSRSSYSKKTIPIE